MNRFRYRQMFLFLVVLVLPTAAIIVQSRLNAAQERENAAQERELAAKRREETRKRTAAEIGQDILARLERIKLQEIAKAPAGAVPQSAEYSDPAVAFVGWEEGTGWFGRGMSYPTEVHLPALNNPISVERFKRPSMRNSPKEDRSELPVCKHCKALSLELQ